MIHYFPLHHKPWGMWAGGSLFIITIHIREPATLMTHAKQLLLGGLVQSPCGKINIIMTLWGGGGGEGVERGLGP